MQQESPSPARAPAPVIAAESIRPEAASIVRRLQQGGHRAYLVGALFGIDATRLLLADGKFQAGAFVPLCVVFAVPLADVATVTVSRLRRGRPVFRGGTDHLSHRLVRLGWPVPRAVALLVLASAVCGIASLLLVHS